MHRTIVALGVALAVGVLGTAVGLTQAAKPKEKPITVTGTLIDTKCYSMNTANKTNDHVTPKGEMKGCAALCARLGIPVAVLTDKNEVWILVTPSQDLVDHMGKVARVTGSAVYGARSVRPDKIEVRDTKGTWTEIKITMPMPM